MTVPAGYPPERHVLRDLLVEIEHREDGTSLGRLPVTRGVLAGGAVSSGAVATLVDVIGGGLAADAARPDWIATADLTLHRVGPVRSGAVEARGRVARKGRSSVVVDVELADGSGPDAPTLGMATMSFSVLPRREENVELPPRAPGRVSMAGPGSGLDVGLEEAIGLRVVDGDRGAVELPIDGYVVNSFGALQGGVVATVAEVSARHLLRAACGAPVDPADLHLTYLALAREGPVRTRARVLAAGPTGGCARVEVLDTGLDDRLVALARVVATGGLR